VVEKDYIENKKIVKVIWLLKVFVERIKFLYNYAKATEGCKKELCNWW